MNHTAHCFLSYDEKDLLLGNFIGDFVKGNTWKAYQPGVQKGILLHRTIDSFTDNHQATRQSIKRIRPFAGRYAPPMVDILYDHLLCLTWDEQSDVDFETFASWTYSCLEKRVLEMPPVLQKRLPNMLKGRFLHGYQTREGLEWVLQMFSGRLSGKVDVDQMVAYFFEEIDQFLADFRAFFPDLKEKVRLQIEAP